VSSLLQSSSVLFTLFLDMLYILMAVFFISQTMDFISQLGWRTAEKAFDSEKVVEARELALIKRAIQYAPSSYGLQPYHVVVVSDKKLKEQLREHSFDQPQITDCSHLFVFCGRTDAVERVDALMELTTDGDEELRLKMKGYEDMMRKAMEKKVKDGLELGWAEMQAYLALGFGLAACAELQVDSCPMEGFLPEKYNELLELPEHMKSVALMAVGFRKRHPRLSKVRFGQDDLFSCL
jgi:nitroreductase / dihydropteridine reductase